MFLKDQLFKKGKLDEPYDEQEVRCVLLLGLFAHLREGIHAPSCRVLKGWEQAASGSGLSSTNGLF